MTDQKLIPNVDYYHDPDGLMVLTAHFLKKRGYCCQSACRHCPYEYASKVDPDVPAELQNPWATKEDSLYEDFED